MARMGCRCGELLSNSLSPNDIELRVYSDKEWDTILEKDAIETWKLPLPTYDVWKCPQRESVYVFKKGVDKAIRVYNLEP